MLHRIRRGLDLPITGVPEQRIEDAPPARRAALIGPDYVGMKPTMEVREGDRVICGQRLLSDKKTGVAYTAPAAGAVEAIHRGRKRMFQSLVIVIDGEDAVEFTAHDPGGLGALAREVVRDQLLQSGLWTAIRARPFSKVANPAETPHSLFVQAIETNPLAPDVRTVLADAARSTDFEDGLHVLTRLTDGPVYLCTAPQSGVPGGNVPGVQHHEFDGPHPAGLPGTHIHLLDPVSNRKSVWYVNYQDVAAIGRLFTTGRIDVSRVIALSGPQVERPRLLRTQLGAGTDELVAHQLRAGENRVISGSVLSGRTATGPFAFLGRFHNQVSALVEGRDREFLGWQMPGSDRFSVTRAFLSAFAADGRRFEMTTNRNGGRRALVPIGSYEKVVPLDILPTQLLRALLVGDSEEAQALGALELDEEDLALCTYVCPGKHEFGPVLREQLNKIEKEG